ncbi:MAG: type II toxin-antitoxin system VapC family toxin [Actinobacteria bacterium]|nr:type II toxin-antitoxin system VapC family toxin [Actinomycetota bacterium]
MKIDIAKEGNSKTLLLKKGDSNISNNGISYVLDSYAILVYFQGEEKGSDFIRSLFEKASERKYALYLCVVNLGEVLYIIEKKMGLQSAQLALSRIKAIPLEIIIADEEITLQAAHIKANFAISYADCFAASVCIARNASLVTGDPEFKLLRNIIDINWI